MLYTCTSLRKQTTFCDGTTGFPVKWHLRNEHRNSVSVTTQIWVVTHHQSMKFLPLFLRCHFTGKPEVVVSKSWLLSQANYLPALILCLAGSGVVTRRPLILQLVHTPPRATTSSKRSSKGIKPKSVEDEDGDSCEKWALHLLLIMTLQNFGCKIIVTNPNKILSHHSAFAPRHLLACQKDIISDKLEAKLSHKSAELIQFIFATNLTNKLYCS